MDNAQKARENRLRAMARRQGLRLAKNPRRDPRAIDYGSYMLVNENNAVVADFGWDHVGFPTDGSWLNDIEAYLTSDSRDMTRETAETTTEEHS